MRILFITPWFGNYRVPVYAHLNELSGENFFLLCAEQDLSELVKTKLKAALGDNVQFLGSADLSFGDDSSTLANSGLVIRRPKDLYKEIKRIKPDVIITEGFGSWAPYGVCYALLHRKKLLMFYERTAWVERNSPWWRTLYRKMIGKFASGFIINGSLTRSYLTDLGFGNYPMTEGCMVADSDGLRNAVDSLSEEEKMEFNQEMRLSTVGLNYLFVGQLVVRKGIAQLLEAWTCHIRKHPHDRIMVVGDGVLRAQLEETYAAEPSISIVGPVGYDKIHHYYAAADVSVMPTLEDNWSLVVPEAMACSLPVATTIYNGCHVELIKDGVNGYAFDILDQADTVRMLDAFHHVDLAQMGKMSAEVVKAYTPRNAAQKMYDLCREVYE